ncbi:alpha-N-acetylneuraminide alpha-2,8-sialyltransferase-like [Antedon mediterranea]|uniref:alpha-N-acetylneuraminide alpha-2,8-sialyltransferase-like n=1 Tax=Antedon mediterranea TaxID=105859 RepID=UPI003AF40DDA
MTTVLRLFSITLGTSFIFSIYLCWTVHAYIAAVQQNIGLCSLNVLRQEPSNLGLQLVNNTKLESVTVRTYGKLEYIGLMSTTNESNRNVSSIFMKAWKQNVSKLEEMRSDLKKVVHTEMILNQRNVKKTQKFKYMINKGSISTNVKFYKLMRQYSPEKSVYKRCSIVGNGGILNGSKCGNEIDKADFVIRCNAPPIGRFKEDAGVKSNITTMNPSIVVKRFGSAQTKNQQSKFINKMKEYRNYVWFPSFSSRVSYMLAVKLNNLLNSKLKSIKFVHGNPSHFKDIRKYWTEKGMRNVPSTGFYITTASLLFCDEVHLYGFWPFSTDIHNRPAAYHYFEDVNLTRVYHAFNQEFDELLNLHMDGVLQLHVDDC